MPKKNRKKSNAGKAMDKAKQAVSSVTKPEVKTIAAPAVSEKKDVAVTNAASAPAKAEVKKEEPKPAPKPEVKAEVKPEPKKEESKEEAPATAKPEEKPAAKAPEKKAVTKKPAAKKTVTTATKTAAAKKPTTAKKPVNKKKAPARKTAAAAPTYETFIEFEGAQINVTPETINAKVLEAYKADGHRPGNIKSLQVYMNLNERRAYYVVNGKAEGKFVEF